jgi:hypothetical protein
MTATTGETTVSVWKMGDCDTDLMTEEKSISAVNSTCHPTQISVHTNNLNDNSIVFGSSLNNITVLDTERFEKIRDFSGKFLGKLNEIFYQIIDRDFSN